LFVSDNFQKSQKLHRVAECLYRNSNGRYFALVKVKGKQIKKSLDTSDRQLANRRLAELREKAQRLHGTKNRNIRFEELAEMWLESIKSGLKPASHARRKVAIKGAESFFRGMQIRSIGYTHIEEWKKNRGATVSARTHNIELESLRLLFQYAIDKGIILENPCRKFKRRRQPRKEIETLSREQFSLLVRELRNTPRAHASGAADLVEFLAYSGLRIGEAREIRLRDINLDQNTLRITGGETGTKNQRERTIQIYPNLRQLLEKILARKPDLERSSHIFKIRSPRKALDLACERLALSHFSVHSLRHFFATNALEMGVHFKTIAEWLGHSDGGVLVARTYGHLRPEFMQAAAQKMTFQVIETPALS
jgi:integrase